MKNRKGFTLVELLVVVVILGIVTGLSIPLIRNIQQSNQDREYSTYMDNLKYSAKLYIDSYGEDLFGRHKSGCAIIRYNELHEKGLLKDIAIDKVSCGSEDTFVKVVKMDDKYGYATSIGCGNVGADGKVKVNIKLPKEGLSGSDTCSVDSQTIMSFTANPSEDSSIKYKKRNIKLTISSETGINDNMAVYYGFSDTKDSNVINNEWKKLPVKIPGKKSQKEDIYEGKTIHITTDDLITPSNVTGKLYLVIQIEKLENLTTDSWTTDSNKDNFLYFGTYTVDNIKPKFNDSTVISSESGFNSIKPKLKLNVTDEKYSTTNDLRMCISYDTDTCSTKISDIRNNSKYEKYNANKVLSNISNSYNSSTHTIYVTVADAAGNYEKANYSYRLANRYTLTYDSNGGVACNPTSKSLTINNWENNATWGTLCTPTRTGYRFLGWNTARNGSGDTITSSTNITGNLTAYAQWNSSQVVWNYSYKGYVEELSVPNTGNYKLEVWGAQGGSDGIPPQLGGAGGKGGAAVGTVYLEAGTKLYIAVGGQGKSDVTCLDSGGWNGGGRTGCVGSSGAGGGATHIAKASGVLEDLKDNKDAILIVAGGGGGAGCHYPSNGGNGGGATGGSVKEDDGTQSGGAGGTQISGGEGDGEGSFGKGANRSFDGGGGGGGYYGGGAAIEYHDSGAGGGSGYLSSDLTDEQFLSELNSGNGKARITFLG